MAKFREREKAIALRKEKQMSYSQIRKIVKVSKSTLSYWLRNYPLPEELIKKLQRKGWKKSEAAIERFRNTMRQKREKRLKETYKIQKKIILPLSDRELFIGGLFLYWGEGAKSRLDSLAVSNTDPSIIKFCIYWLNKSFNISKRKMRVYLQLYSDMDIDKEKEYWSKTLKIPLSQFGKPYIKKTSSERINHKGSFGHGTCGLKISGVSLAEKVFMSLKAISDWRN